ncbi:protein TANC2-like [Mytilus edulis]|uniref:protein TANC2-like n=1 Tax=Mytilus edulis TaxID=6550 RepID=UPI0039EEF53D
MRFKDHWNLDSLVDFNSYVENLHNQSIVRRNWLIEEIDDKMATSETGIILIAEMGYGKSSIVSNIVCAEQSSDWYVIRKHVLTYHFCRYDSIRSTNAAYFIRNIASAIVSRYPELGNFILMDEIANDILFGLRCSEDPVSCLEKGILNPLQNNWNSYQLIIVIDALDECNSEDKNNILQLLFKQIDNFPQNIKFIFTSRNIEQVVSKFRGLHFIELSRFSKENEKDIIEYIEKISQISKPEMNLLTKVSRGNFLHVKLYLQSCEKSRNCDFKKIPSSLEKVYQINFERAFDTQSCLFEELRPIFEVLCTMTKPLKENQILKVANITPENRRKTERMIGNELGHFIITSDGYLSFLHKSIADFLTCSSRKHLRFFVHKENGHKLFGAYLLNLRNISESDLVDVVHHVAMSRNEEWQNILIHRFAKQILNYTNLPLLFYLHEAVTDFNSYATTHLLLKITIMQYINDTDDRHMSAAFIAASHGNEQALKCLLDYGADPYFQVPFPYTIKRRFLTDIVHKCKYIYFCGYNILHIASQNGHIQVVQMLVERFNDFILFTRNDMNLTAFDLAAENGHIAIATYLLNKNNSFANFISLHHAAENGHSSIVNLLLQYGLKDNCVPCNGSIFWIPSSHGRIQQDYRIKYANLINVKYISFYDDWYLITCDTALNAAVRNGHLKVVELLLNEATNTLNCTAFDGKTPIMTAVQYNQNTVVRLLLNVKVDFTARCRNDIFPKRRAMYSLDKSELNNLTRERCGNVHAEDEFQKAVTTIPEIYDFLSEFDGQHIPKIKLSRANAIKCNGKVSPMHNILQNDRGKFWMYSNTDSLKTVLSDFSAKYLDLCVDSKGYNVLQRAVIGGNIAAVKYLIEKGMTVQVLSRKGYNLLYLGMLDAPVSQYDRMPLYYHDSNHFRLIQDIWTTGNVTQHVSTVDYSETLGYILNVMFELSNTDLDYLNTITDIQNYCQ